ncbi:MAG: hypothetical protein IPK58_02730 [Acidobacteria bacterium]|nr:hypothetical protein [Acidobacteriota bacterium]
MSALITHFGGNRFYERDQNNKIVDTKASTKVMRYFYTTEKGWIDMHHFFRVANWARQFGETLAQGGGSFGEAWQRVTGNASANSYEDAASNQAGIEFWSKYGEQIASGEISAYDAVENFLKDLGATDPEKAPNYSMIPHMIKETPSVTSDDANGLKGEDLRKKFEEWWNSLTEDEQKRIKEAHEQIENRR